MCLYWLAGVAADAWWRGRGPHLTGGTLLATRPTQPAATPPIATSSPPHFSTHYTSYVCCTYCKYASIVPKLQCIGCTPHWQTEYYLSRLHRYFRFPSVHEHLRAVAVSYCSLCAMTVFTLCTSHTALWIWWSIYWVIFFLHIVIVVTTIRFGYIFFVFISIDIKQQEAMRIKDIVGTASHETFP